MKKIAIMQPYLLPYIGYWQLISAVDEFVIYDNIEYTKKGWINRNRYLLNGKDELFSISLKADSDYSKVVDRVISADFNRDKLIGQIENAYRKAPYFGESFPLIRTIFSNQENNLFRYILQSVHAICDHLNIGTKITVSSDVDIDHQNLKAQEKVLAICKAQKASSYYNPPGGVELYSRNAFEKAGVNLHFLKPQSIAYVQFDNAFVPNLSIIDLLMFNGQEEVSTMLGKYDLQ